MGIRNVNTNPWHQQHKEVKFGFPAITSLLISLFQIVLQFLVAIADGVEERVVTVRCALLPLRMIRFSYFCYATTIATCAPISSDTRAALLLDSLRHHYLCYFCVYYVTPNCPGCSTVNDHQSRNFANRALTTETTEK